MFFLIENRNLIVVLLIEKPCSLLERFSLHAPHPPWSPTREHSNGVDFRPPVLEIHRRYTRTNEICAIDPFSHCVPGIIYKRKNI